MEEAHRAECIHEHVLQLPPQFNFSPWVNLTDQALSWSVYNIHDEEKFTIPIRNISAKISYQIDRYVIEI